MIGGIFYSVGAAINLGGGRVFGTTGLIGAHDLFHLFVVAGSLRIHFAFVAQVVVQQDGEARCKESGVGGVAAVECHDCANDAGQCAVKGEPCVWIICGQPRPAGQFPRPSRSHGLLSEIRKSTEGSAPGGSHTKSVEITGRSRGPFLRRGRTVRSVEAASF